MSEDSSKAKEKPKVKSKAVGEKIDEGGKPSSGAVDILSEPAMTNAYLICHNVQDLMYYRGFNWEGQSKGKGKGKKKKR